MDLNASNSSIQLPPEIEMLDENRILSFLAPVTVQTVSQLIVLGKTESTNSYLLDWCSKPTQSRAVCVAESQTKGRGRRGRRWISPPGHNVYLSISWRFSRQPKELSGLSLAIGLAVIRTLKRYGISELSLKWPNDIYHCDQKLAGILVDIVNSNDPDCLVVIGIGVNRWIDSSSADLIDRQWVDLFTMLGNKMPSRNHLVATMIEQLINVLTQFEMEGFPGFYDEWQQWDYLQGQQVALKTGKQTVCGIACGVDRDGLLIIEDENSKQLTYSVGEVELAHS